MIKLTRSHPLDSEAPTFRLNPLTLGLFEARSGDMPGTVIITTFGRMEIVRESEEAIMRLIGKGVPGE